MALLDDDNSSLSGGAPNSTANVFGLDEDQSLGELDEMDDAPATMVKTETPKWTAEQLRQTLLEAQKQLLLSATTVTSSSSNRAESNASTVDSTQTTTTEQSGASSTNGPLSLLPPTTSANTSTNEINFQPQRLFIPPLNQPPVLGLRSVVAQLDSTQRKQAMVRL